MWPRKSRQGVPLGPSFNCVSGHALQWEKEDYRVKLVLCEETYMFCL